MTTGDDMMVPAGPVVLEVRDEEGGQRLDRFLAQRMAPAISRSRLQALIEEGCVTVDGASIGDPGRRVKPGERCTIRLPQPEPAGPLAEAMPLAIVHEDAQIIVIDKPAGLVVHPAAGHAGGTLVNALLAHCGDSLSGIGGVRRPGIVHRLDKDTSGLLVVAKTDAAHRALSEQFSAHGVDGRLHRAYLALVWGRLERPRGTIDAALARSASNRTRIAVAKSGRRAVTRYRVVRELALPSGKVVASLVRLELETGRTHQIRVHMAHIGHPVMGDPVYAVGHKASGRQLRDAARSALERLGRQALHAAELGFVHPESGRRLDFASPLPEDFANLLAVLGGEPANPAEQPDTAR